MSVYYNEYDNKTALWLRELIADDLIPRGEVDTRSITDVQASDLRGYSSCHFFAGIGGWAYAGRLAGLPDDYEWWSGSCPCQPFSSAGKGLGQKDERHLWPVFARLVAECRPPIVVGEQVASAIGHGWLDGVYADLEGAGYAVGAAVLGAHSVNAPHQRQRLYWAGVSVADGDGGRLKKQRGAESMAEDIERTAEIAAVELRSATCGVADYSHRREWSCVSKTNGSNGNEGKHRGDSSTGGMADTDNLGRCAGHGEAQSEGGKIRFWGSVEFGDGCADSGMADTEGGGRRMCGGAPGGTGYLYQCSTLVYCRDGKYRRIPAQSVLCRSSDGVSYNLDEMRAEGGFPLCRKKEVEGRVMLLRGYGNAIISQVAAEFLRAVIP